MSKLALLIGINYIGTPCQLSGCINDIKETKKILKKVYKYEEKDIVSLTDETQVKPTADNIIDHLKNLAKRTNSEDIQEVWISYSGHGSYITDDNGDEDDKRDECLVPLDYDKSGLIRDDKIHMIIGYISSKTKIKIVIDACHSETIIDLPYRYISGNKNVIENNKNKVKSNCLMISGCRDIETSADAYNIDNSHKFSGAMTSSLLSALKKFNYTITCWKLLKEMRKFLKDRQYKQIPQLSSSRRLDDKTIFSKT